MNQHTAPSVTAIEKILVFFISLGVLTLFTHNSVFLAGNDASRFAQIEALVDYHHPYINESRYSWTIDRVTLNGRDFSNKPPFLSIAGAGVYYLLSRIPGVSFAGNEHLVVYLLTLLLVGLSSAWLAVKFYAATQKYFRPERRVQYFAAASLMFGTILTSFSVTLNNHTVAAAFLFAAFCAVIEEKAVKAGFWASLAFCADPAPGAIFLAVFSGMLRHSTKKGSLVRYLLSASLAPALFCASNLVITGSVLPVKMISGGYDHSGQFAPNLGGVLLPDDWFYPLKCLFGWHGFFTVSPVLLPAIFGLVKQLRCGEVLGRARTRWLGAGIAATILFHIFFAGSYGGWSYGFRYLIPIIPLCLFFLPPVIRELNPFIFAALLAASTLFAFIGAYHPWPPGYEQEAGKDPVVSLVKNPIGGNASAWLHEKSGTATVTKMAESVFLHEDILSRYLYLNLFFESKGDIKTAEKIRDEYVRIIKNQ
ncbi:MAG TPA: hypothetical protein DER10_08525 [Elusimicrobia bacterium]|nr:MAG: hypothetical protein A2X33_00435 [Elusimicrobia bacterium GWA2_51_34]HAF96337.1 hypothetical protein [Elusimicrobiota bacterium]HCE98523.1 hypothetical protein [Elusimicrobiota bacterium]